LATGFTDVYILVCKGCTKVIIVLIRAPIDIFMLSDVLKSDRKNLDPNSIVKEERVMWDVACKVLDEVRIGIYEI